MLLMKNDADINPKGFECLLQDTRPPSPQPISVIAETISSGSFQHFLKMSLTAWSNNAKTNHL